MKNHMNKTLTALAAVMLAGLAAPMATADHETALPCSVFSTNPASEDQDVAISLTAPGYQNAARLTTTGADDELYFWSPSTSGYNGAESKMTVYKVTVVGTQEICEHVRGPDASKAQADRTTPIGGSTLNLPAATYILVFDLNVEDTEAQARVANNPPLPIDLTFRVSATAPA